MVNYHKTIRRVRLKDFPADIQLKCQGVGRDQKILVTLRNVVCRYTEELIELYFTYDALNTDDRNEALLFVKKCIIWSLMHELDECFYYRGKLHFDPHIKGETHVRSSLIGRV